MNDAELVRLLEPYRRSCGATSVESLPGDEARIVALRVLALLEPAFDAEFRKQ